MFRKEIDRWMNSSFISENFKSEINRMDDNEKEECFYKSLQFGTGGLRGKMGVGSNRMNYVTISKATQGYANYLLKSCKDDEIKVNIAYDSRNNSKYFAEVSAGVLAANGIKVNVFESLRPTPELSFSVSHLNAHGGIVITASHNPKEYNGYKVYNGYGGQITDAAAKEIIQCVNDVEDFNQIKADGFDTGVEKGDIKIIGEEIDSIYMDRIKSIIKRRDMIEEDGEKLKIVYTPIHGSGNIPVRRVLDELGFKSLKVVKEQEMPDGDFSTVSYPNPEDPNAFEIALELAKEYGADIILGTDPDCDRIGVFSKEEDGYFAFNGNMIGILLSDYILSAMEEGKGIPDNGEIIKTIVTTDMIKRIALKKGINIVDLLTGFKYIGERIHQTELSGEKKFIFGLEESYGYLSGDFVKDKDAVIAAALVCEMALYHKNRGVTLKERLEELYKEYGYFKEHLISITLDGKAGAEKIATAVERLRNMETLNFEGFTVERIEDYRTSERRFLKNGGSEKIDLPSSNVIKVVFDDESWFVVRPSGTEPKIKVYLSVNSHTDTGVESKRELLINQIENLLELLLK